MERKRSPSSHIKDEKFPYFFLSAVGFLVYCNSFFNYFLWDDELLIIKNGYIRSWANIFKIFHVDIFHWTTNSNFYRPLFSLSLIFDYSLWHLNPFGYHLTNFLLHLSNACLIFYLIKFISDNYRVSLIASLLFLVHPVQTEAITYISGRADPLATLFVLLSLLTFIKSSSLDTTKRQICYFFSVFFFILGFLSKETALVLPILLLLYEFTFSSNLEGFYAITKRLYKHLTFILLTFTYFILRINLLPPSLEGMVPDSLFLRVANLPRVFLFYFYVLILPFNLRVERFFSLSKTLDLPIIFSTLLFILISLWMVKIRRSSRLIFFFSAWFFINLLAVANIIFPLNAAISEHWLYLPSIGFFYLAAVLLNKTLEGRWLFAPLENPAVQSGNDNNIRINSMQRAEYKVPHFLAGFMKWDPTLKFKKTILMIIVVTLCLLTVSRNFEWKSPITLFESTLKATKGRLSFRDLRVCLNLACAYAQRGRLDEAIEEFKKILIIRPDSKKIRYNLGLAYANKGLDEEAEKELLEALNIDSHFLQPYYLLGLIYLKKQNYDKANAIWDRMLQVKPEYPQDEILLKRVILMKEKLKQKLPVLEKDFKLGE